RWCARVGVQGSGWQPMPPVVGAVGPAADGVGGGAGCVRLDGSAVDPGEGRLADWPVVPRALHAAGYLISVTPHRVQPADAGPPCRRAGREGHRRVAHRDLGEGSRIAAATGAWICFEDEAGQTLRPPKARTWAPRGRTPVVAVSGKGSGRVSVAGLVCLTPATRVRLFCRIRRRRARKAERRSLSE